MKGRAFLRSLNGYSQIEPLDNRLLMAIQPLVDPAPSYPQFFTTIGSTTIFAADDGVHGRELWKTDGTPAGTTMLKDLVPGASGTSTSYIAMNEYATIGSKKYFLAPKDNSYICSIWVTDGTTAGTKVVATLKGKSSNQIVSPYKIAALGKSLYVYANYYYPPPPDDYSTYDSDPPSFNFYKINSETGALTLVKEDIGYGFETELAMKTVGNKLYFTSYDYDNGCQLWSTDGNTIKSIAGFGSYPIRKLVAMNNMLYFGVNVGGAGFELMRSDGTGAGTRLVKDINPNEGVDGISDMSLVAIGNRLYFNGNDGVHGNEAWISDGTIAGTKMLRDIYQPNTEDDSGPGGFTALGDKVYFAARTKSTGPELWMTDGTTSGTKLVKDINPGAEGSSPIDLTAVGDTLYFAASDGKHGRELWKSNASGTVMVKDINPYDSEGPRELIAVGNRVIYRADDFWHGAEPWISDGTSTGTFMLKDIFTPAASIEGKLFNDLDHDGKWDAGEMGLANRTIYLDLNNNGKLDYEDPNGTTDSYGRYFFTGLAAGKYVIRQVLPKGWAQSAPANGWGYKVSVMDGQQLKGAYHMTYQI